jgi:DNA-binding Lrp family transcriptional regulator
VGQGRGFLACEASSASLQGVKRLEDAGVIKRYRALTTAQVSISNTSSYVVMREIKANTRVAVPELRDAERASACIRDDISPRVKSTLIDFSPAA